MAWNWTCEKADGTVVEDAATATFPTQADAETWIGESWRDLLADGIDSVTLHEDGRKVYGPMSLHPAE